jgi:Amt family ammonium transporter
MNISAPELLPAFILPVLLLSPLAPAGLALLNTGLARSRSAAQILLGSICIFAISIIAFAFIGASIAGPQHAFLVSTGRLSWNWFAFGPTALHAFPSAAPIAQLTLLFETLAAVLACLIPWGAGADRLRLAAGCASAAVLSAFIFPLVAHWVWGGGWLSQLASATGLDSSFLDPSGAATIQVLGGLAALATVWIAGPRRGKFPREGLATAMPAHNTVYVLLGCLIALVGWIAFNSAGAMLFLAATPATVAVTVLNTLLAASGAVLAALIVTRVRFGKPDASLCANGWLAGLVTSSACAPVISPGAALFTGAVAGIFTPLLVEVLELALSIDDPTGAITVHAAGGLWGLFAAGVFSTQKGQLLAQLVGIAALLGVFLPLVYGVFALINRFIPFRADADGERLGMDLHELGGTAYPEFVIHRDDSYR